MTTEQTAKDFFSPDYLFLIRNYEKEKPDDTLHMGSVAPKVCETPRNRYLPIRGRTVNERVIQLLWKRLLFNSSSMKTTDGLPLKVLKPGRFNRREGPDFRNSVLVLNGQKIACDIEIHIHAKDWYDHKHHLSKHYDRTLLHVFIHKSEGTRSAVNRNGKKLYELDLSLYLRHPLEELQIETEKEDIPLSCRPHCPPCSTVFEKLGQKIVDDFLNNVGEGRMLLKSNRILDRMESVLPREVLYELFFEALGYSSFKNEFRKLARNFELTELENKIKSHPNIKAEEVVQAVFLRLSSLDSRVVVDENDVELKSLLEKFEEVNLSGIEPIFKASDWKLLGCRPANHPQRRIAAFSYIATKLCNLKDYEKIIFSIIEGDGGQNLRREVGKLINLFTSVSDTFWDRRYRLDKKISSPKRLIGRDRAISLVVDSFIPFFLSVSRCSHNLKMEKVLLAIFYSTPKPTSNATIDFMLRNIFGKADRKIAKNVVHQQALIQLYNDFCFKAPAFCDICPLPEQLSRLNH